MSHTNGTKRWLVGVATALLLGYASWVSLSIIQHGQAIAAQQAAQTHLEQWLERIEHKLDTLLEHRAP